MGINFSAKILNNAISSLNAQQAVIATTSNNIANVNTPGYSRRTIDLQTKVTRADPGVINVGNGVDIGTISQITDTFLDRLLHSTISDKSSYDVQSEFLSRAEELFNISGEGNTIGSALTAFFTAIQDLTTDPSSIELRSNLIERGNDLVSVINNTYNSLANLQTEADSRLANEVESINSLASQIAEINSFVSAREANGTVAADERDKRELLLQKLSEKVSYNSVEASDGSVSVFLSNGFALVSGSNSRSMSVTTNPSFASGSLPPSLEGGILSYVVYDYDPGASAAHVDLTQVLAAGGGTMGGLLAVRGYAATTNTSAFQATGSLVDLASRIEAISRALLTNVNTEYLGPDEDSGTAGLQPSSGDLDGNVPSAYGLFTFAFGGTRDVDGDGRPDDLSDPALGIDNFSSILQFAPSDPRNIAAARDFDGAPGATSFPPGDSQNLDALSALSTTDFALAVGSFSITGTLDDVYNTTVTRVGNLKNQVELNREVAEQNFTTTSNRRDEISGVSLDEEFTNLIKFQKAFEASARLIRVAGELLDQIVNVI